MAAPIRKAWREAATLIVAARSSVSSNGYDYKILCMKRSAKTSFLPNNISFPGGAMEKQDESLEWLNHFKRLGITDNDLHQLKHSGSKSFMFKDKKSVISRNISVRICALRETFEELGVLLHSPPKTNSITRNYSKFYRGIDIKTYQKKVHNRSIRLLDLYKELNILPDIFNIYEWSAWLTPTYFSNRRFETAFYLCALNEQPPAHPESIEADSFMWRTPEEYLQMLKNDEVWFHPPQLYEFSRLLNFKKLDDLLKFAKEREPMGMNLFMPVVYNCTDGLVMTMPGDDAYPKEPNYVEKTEIDETVKNLSMHEFQRKSINLNRIQMSAPHDCRIICNTKQPNGHKDPLTIDSQFLENVKVDTLKTKL